MKIKRLFFGLEVEADWPEKFPKGRLLEEKERHITLAFLGNVPYEKVLNALDGMPKPPFEKLEGVFSDLLFLPPRKAVCASWHAVWNEGGDIVASYQKKLSRYWFEKGLLSEDNCKRDFLPHTTICRSPFSKKEWEEAFSPLPFTSGKLHLYESRGNSRYEIIWTND